MALQGALVKSLKQMASCMYDAYKAKKRTLFISEYTLNSIGLVAKMWMETYVFTHRQVRHLRGLQEGHHYLGLLGHP